MPHIICAQNDESMMHKPHSTDSASATCRSKTPTSCMSSLHLRPQISVKLPAISMKKVQKNPDQLTIEDLPAIRSQVLCIRILGKTHSWWSLHVQLQCCWLGWEGLQQILCSAEKERQVDCPLICRYEQHSQTPAAAIPAHSDCLQCQACQHSS